MGSPSFDAVHGEHAGYVYNLALRLTGKPSDADDVYQETFLRVHRFLPQYRGDGLKSWLRRITTNVFYSRYRKAEREEPSDTGTLEIATEADEPGALLDAAAVGGKLADALFRLSPELRAAMVLRSVEELSYQEIAELLEVPVGTVRSRLSRAREQLLHYLEEP